MAAVLEVREHHHEVGVADAGLRRVEGVDALQQLDLDLGLAVERRLVLDDLDRNLARRRAGRTRVDRLHHLPERAGAQDLAEPVPLVADVLIESI